MGKLLTQVTTPTALLYIFLTLTQIGTGVYLASGVEPPPLFTFLDPIGFLWIVGWWLRADSAKRGFRWVYDLGLFLYMVWPLLLPWYLIKTRGARALLVILVFSGAYIAATVVGFVLYLLLAPEGWPTAV